MFGVYTVQYFSVKGGVSKTIWPVVMLETSSFLVTILLLSSFLFSP